MIVLSRVVVLIALATPWMLLALDWDCTEDSGTLFSLIGFPFGIFMALAYSRRYVRDIEFYKRGPQYYPVDSGITLLNERDPDFSGYLRLLVFYPMVFVVSSFFVMFPFMQMSC
jgi:hypothetical protein